MMDESLLLLRTIDMMLLQGASSYPRSDYKNKQWRSQSVSSLEDCYHGVVRILGGETVFEIGAHQASFSKKVQQKSLPNAQIFAFEANPYVYDNYKKGDPDLSGKQNLHYLKLAITDYKGSVEFDIVKTVGDFDISNRRGFHSILERAEDQCTYERVKVDCTTIHDFIEDHGLKGNFHAWIDVEGASRQVLTGIGDHLKDFASFLIEVEDSEKWRGQWLWHDVLNFMLNHGFFPVKRDFEYRSQFNVVFIRQDLLDDPELKANLTYYTLHT